MHATIKYIKLCTYGTGFTQGWHLLTDIFNNQLPSSKVVHKQMSILTFEGLSTTFEVLVNVSLVIYIHNSCAQRLLT